MTETYTETTPSAADSQDVTLEEGRRLLDDAAQRNLHMSGEAFIAAWDSGGFNDPDSLRVQQVASLLPFAR